MRGEESPGVLLRGLAEARSGPGSFCDGGEALVWTRQGLPPRPHPHRVPQRAGVPPRVRLVVGLERQASTQGGLRLRRRLGQQIFARFTVPDM